MLSSTKALLIFALVGLGNVPTVEAQSARYLLAVGNNRGMPSEVQLVYAEKDARAFAQALQSSGEVPQANTVVLTGKSGKDIYKALNMLAAKIQMHDEEDVVLFFYYSGHGSNENLHVGGHRVSLKELETRMGRIKAGLRIAIIDACRSDTDLNYKGFRRTNNFAVKLESPSGVKGVVTLKSSSEGEASQESDSLRGAVFTHYLLTALRGAADFDRNDQVSLHEAYAYAYRQTVQRSAQGPGNVMHPSAKLDVEGVGDLVLTKTSSEQAKVVLPRGLNAKYLLYHKGSGSLMAEVWSDETRDIIVKVPAGSYVLQRRFTNHHGAYEFRVQARQREQVEHTKFYPFPQATLVAKGGFLSVWRHELTMGGGASYNHKEAISKRARISYSYGVAMSAAGVALEVGQVEYAIENYDVGERWIGGDIFYARRRALGPFDLRGGVAWRFTEQELTRADATLLGEAGYSTTSTSSALSAGPSVAIGWRLNLSPRWYLSLDLGVHGWIRKEGGSFQFRPEGVVGSALGVDF